MASCSLLISGFFRYFLAFVFDCLKKLNIESWKQDVAIVSQHRSQGQNSSGTSFFFTGAARNCRLSKLQRPQETSQCVPCASSDRTAWLPELFQVLVCLKVSALPMDPRETWKGLSGQFCWPFATHASHVKILLPKNYHRPILSLFFLRGWIQQQAFSFEMFVSTSFVALWTICSFATKRWVKVRPEERKKKLPKHENRAKREMIGFWSGEFGSLPQGSGRKWVRFKND